MTCNILKCFTVQCREEYDSGTFVAEKFALIWVVCLNTSGMLETATDDLSSIIFALSDFAENIFTV